MVLARPWSKGSIEAWASAKRFTKDKRDSAVTLPLVKLPKARVKVDKGLHLWTSQHRGPERLLMEEMQQEDPEMPEVEVTTYEDTDWLNYLDKTLGRQKEIESNSGEEDGSEEETESINYIKRNKPLGQCPLEKKMVTLNPHVSCSDGEQKLLHVEKDEKPMRKYIISNYSDPFDKIDRKYMGKIIETPSGQVHIEPEYAMDRMCNCTRCIKQLPGCRRQPCPRCKPIPERKEE